MYVLLEKEHYSALKKIVRKEENEDFYFNLNSKFKDSLFE